MPRIAIIGAGPSGLFAAEHLAARGHAVTVYDRMPSPGRKFLLAGRGGLNLTHNEAAPAFLARYRRAADWVAPWLAAFPPEHLRAWCEGLGQPIFVGSSGRIFPATFKAAPLLRAWLRRLGGLGVDFVPQHRWCGWTAAGALQFATPQGDVAIAPDATLLALGGASWPRMGADGGWVPILRDTGIAVADLRPSNCGVRIAWSPIFRARFEGVPLKRVAFSVAGETSRGEAVVTAAGLEGGGIYAMAAPLRDQLDRAGAAVLTLDMRPDADPGALAERVDGVRGGVSLANHLRQRAGLPPVAIGLVQEALHAGHAPAPLSRLIKALPLQVTGLQPIGRAISSAGGITPGELGANLMLRQRPGVFAAGEMLDWEAPTGGYLLQACFSSGYVAAQGIDAWLRRDRRFA